MYLKLRVTDTDIIKSTLAEQPTLKFYFYFLNYKLFLPTYSKNNALHVFDVIDELPFIKKIYCKKHICNYFKDYSSKINSLSLL